MKKRYFIITVDTEGDDLWHYKKGTQVKTENTLYIPRFQELCEKYGFKPVYLTNYEMVCDDRYVDYIKQKTGSGLCEVGIHIHAWNNPPLYDLHGQYNGNPYLIEYPEDIMREKLLTTANLIKEKFGFWPVSHRAGRWAMNKTYFKLLKDHGIKVDCSYTPHVNWCNCSGESVANGPDYSKVSDCPQYINGVLEVPVSIDKYRLYGALDVMKNRGIKGFLTTLLYGKRLWLRPSGYSAEEMIQVVRTVSRKEHTNNLEMMLHSSELMPGGSPSFQTPEAIDGLFDKLTTVFDAIEAMGYKGITLKDFEKEFAKYKK